MKKRALFLLALLLSLTTLRAYTQEESYTISAHGKLHLGVEELRIQTLKVQSLIVGGIATTQLDITLFNPSNRVLSGEFFLPLPPDWTLDGFSLDINGKLRKAVTVPKAQGREAYKAVVRRGIDPALVEHVEGNCFRTHIYPFSPHGTRRIVLTLDHPIPNTQGKDAYVFPYTFSYPIRHFSLDLRIVERPAKGAQIEGLTGARLSTSRHETALHYAKENAELAREIKVTLPRSYSPSLVQAQDDEGIVYALPLQSSTAEGERPKPKYLDIIWDVSESQRGVSKEKVMALLKEYLRWIDHGKIRLYPFAEQVYTPTAYVIQDGKCDNLFSDLADLQYDGGTNLNAIPWEEFGEEAVSLLVSNGIQTLPYPLAKPHAQNTVFCINPSTIQAQNWLQQLALSTGGAYVNLSAISIPEGLQLLRKANSVALAWGVGFANYHSPTAVPPQTTRWVYGLSNRKVNSLIAQWVGRGKSTMQVNGKDSPLWKDEAIAALLRRGYYQQEVSRLRNVGKDQESEALARREGIVTPKTSLIVLEDVADYAKYHITPPEELRDAYNRLQKQERDLSDSLRKLRLEALVKASERQTEWWKRSVPLGNTLKKTQQENIAESRVRARAMTSSMAVADGVREVVRAHSEADVAEMEETEAPGNGKSSPSPRGHIQLTPWDSQSPYLKVLQYAEKGKELKTYYRLKGEYGDNPAFYLDAAGFFFSKGMKAEGYRALTSVLEIAHEATELLRAVAKECEKHGYPKLAEAIYRKLILNAPHEPQPLRDLALLLSQQKDYQQAIDLLYEVATGVWDHRFQGVELIALNEMNSILDQNPLHRFDIKMIDSRLLKHEPVDVRIVLSWGNDDTDVDLHVVDPTGEECYFGHRETAKLGKLSNDITQGYGPEEYMQRRGLKGEYIIKAKLFADHTQMSIVPKYVHAICYLHYGTPQQQKQELTLRIEEVKDVVEIGRVVFK